MSHYVCAQCGHEEAVFKRGGGRETAERLAVPFLGEIPIDPRVVIGGDSGQPIVALHPDSPAALVYVAIAEKVARGLCDAATSAESIQRE